ncbi:iron ABC transporter permease [Oceanotoga sp. DSM 15011]|uniref:Bacillibactin ABC transporter integral membrane protein n=1 Tax=Oceanotoga teriensis TaxID=515440 RepID=A0AA45C6J7_9BACT|nr:MULTISPECIES: iron ABC transporter permease [Oceanotoga]PWJ92150.1 bacillibactin ABC transporter integral membrane protein [Oceanotoga teriensis]UYO99366.1 iron ABC transporter permease [Oceanotoga sp. DSM 15011]
MHDFLIEEKRIFRRNFFIILILSIFMVLISIKIGTFEMTFKDVIETIFRINPSKSRDLVIFEFRMPRIILSGFIGFGLGIAGSVVQTVTKNELADPGILGINAGAGASVITFMFFFKDIINFKNLIGIMIMPIFGIFGGLFSAILIFYFSSKRGFLNIEKLILIGIALSSGFGAYTLFISLKMNPDDYEMAMTWLSGSTYNANWNYILGMIPWFLIFIPYIIKKSDVLDIMQLEDENIISLGVELNKERKKVLISSIAIVSTCVAFSGSIGFVGLIAPHISRRLVGIKHKYMLKISGMIGMFLVIISDFVAKNISPVSEVPVGVVISIIGVPYFLFLMFKSKGR